MVSARLRCAGRQTRRSRRWAHGLQGLGQGRVGVASSEAMKLLGNQVVVRLHNRVCVGARGHCERGFCGT